MRLNERVGRLEEQRQSGGGCRACPGGWVLHIYKMGEGREPPTVCPSCHTPVSGVIMLPEKEEVRHGAY